MAAVEHGHTDALHYQTLNGRSLRDMSAKKMHHGNGRFLNPMGIGRKGRFWQLLQWKLFRRNLFAGYLDGQKVTPISLDWEPVKDHNGVSVTYVKHATLLIKVNGRYLLVDPVLGAMLWFIKDFSPLKSPLDDMPRPDHLLITHGHYDHLDMDSLRALDPASHVVSPLGYDPIFKDIGMLNRTRLDWYETCKDKGLTLTLLPANHWTMRNPFRGPNRSLWGGYMIQASDGYTIYLSGDTAYFDGFEQIGREFDIDLAIFNLGAYEPRWFMAPSHINPRETVRAFKELKADKLMVVHWGSFRLGDEPVHFPPRDIKKALVGEAMLDRLVDLPHGSTYFAA